MRRLALLLLAAPALAAAPVVLPRSELHDFTSRVNGRRYRVEVATPFRADPAKPSPAFYVLDGNWYFLAAAENVTEAGKTITPAIVVGVGYPTFDNDLVARRRMTELGSDDFMRVLLEEIKPWVNAHYRVDPARQILYGKSMGGLAVLRTWFRHPDAFSVWVAASPAILFHDSALLREPQPAVRPARMLITVGGNEDPARMIGPAAAMARRLGAAYWVIAGENHVSVSLASLGRAINFALPPPPRLPVKSAPAAAQKST